ncbi:hypothetical protein IGJ87_000261 [Enterococcus sp. DIV1411a]
MVLIKSMNYSGIRNNIKYDEKVSEYSIQHGRKPIVFTKKYPNIE